MSSASTATETKKPEKTFRLGNLSCSVFANEHGDRTFRTVLIQRSYREGDDFKYTTSLNSTDLPNVIRLLEAVHSEIGPLDIHVSE